MGAMHEFLERMETEEIRTLYRDVDETWNRRARELNERLRANGLPVQVANLSSIWTVGYLTPSRYNWMFQYYLRAAGLALSWVGTGRLIFSLDYTEESFAAVADRFVAAAQAMQRDAWWWADERLTNKAVRRQILKELLQARWRSPSSTEPIGSMSSPRSRASGAL
jgi:glutamate-1-semialdehyde 2,1-aminomutase